MKSEALSLLAARCYQRSSRNNNRCSTHALATQKPIQSSLLRKGKESALPSIKQMPAIPTEQPTLLETIRKQLIRFIEHNLGSRFPPAPNQE